MAEINYSTEELVEKTGVDFLPCNERDYLDVDPEIAGQKYACFSFVSPQGRQKCNILGFKLRGSYDTKEEAEAKCRRLRSFDPDFDIFITKVGYWLPFCPDPNEIENEEYFEGQLNALVQGYKENMIQKDQYFEERKRQLMKEAMREGTREGQEELSNKREHPFSVKFRLESLSEKVKKLKEDLEESEEKLKETEELWATYTEEEINQAEEQAKKEKEEQDRNSKLEKMRELDRIQNDATESMNSQFGENIIPSQRRKQIERENVMYRKKKKKGRRL